MKLRRILLPLVALSFVVGACSSDDDDSVTDSSEGIAAPTTVAGTEAPAVTDAPAETDAPAATEAPNVASTVVVPDEDIDRDATLRIAFPSLAGDLDPHKNRSAFILITNALYDTLTYIDGNNELHPGVAESWETSDDGLSLTLHIREGITFGDGSDLTADAVKASLERAKTLEESLYKAHLGIVNEVIVEDDYTVSLELAEPDTSLPYRLAGQAGAVINPAALADGTNLSEVSAGSTPYDVVEWNPEQRFVIERREGAEYWDPQSWTPRRIEMSSVGDPNAITNGFATGEFDMVRYSSGGTAALEQLGDEDFQWAFIPSDGWMALWIRKTGALNTPEIRRALWQAVDIKTITESVVTECDYNTQLVRPGNPAYVEGLNPYEYDPDAAHAVLDGLDLNFEILLASTQINETRVAELLKEELESNFGVGVTLTPLTVGEAAGGFSAGDRDSLLIGSAAQPDFALSIIDTWVGARALPGDDLPNWQELIDAANALPLDSPERAEALQALHEYALNDHVALMVCNHVNVWASLPNVAGVDETMGWGNLGVFQARNVHILND